MLGPISKPLKVRKPLEREGGKGKKGKETHEIEEPESIIQSRGAGRAGEGQVIDEEKGEATFERITTLEQLVIKATATSTSSSATNNGFSSLDILVDTQDHVQTVENFFDFAFLVKEGEVLTKV